MKHYEGIIPAAYTPFDPGGKLDQARITDLAQLYRSQGLPAVFICGSTGESHSLTTEERKQVAEAWGKETRKGFDLIVQVGSNSQADAVALAAHARSTGAAAISSFAPNYYRPECIDDLVSWLEPIAAGAPELPFYFYDIPSMTGVEFPMESFVEKASARIGNFAGLKFTNSDLMRLQACLDFDNSRMDILFGTDEILLAALALGVKGGVGSTYNYAAPVYLRLIDAFGKGDLEAARREQRKSVRLVSVLLEYGVLRAGKAIMGLIGIDCGPVRPPVRPLAGEELSQIYEALADLDIFSRPLQPPGA